MTDHRSPRPRHRASDATLQAGLRVLRRVAGGTGGCAGAAAAAAAGLVCGADPFAVATAALASGFGTWAAVRTSVTYTTGRVLDAHARISDEREQVARERTQEWVERWTGRLNGLAAEISALGPGATTAPRSPQAPPAPPLGGSASPIEVLDDRLTRLVEEVLAAAKQAVQSSTTAEAPVLGTIARRIEALISKVLPTLDEVQRLVADTKVLGKLYTIDHVLMRAYRMIFNLHTLLGVDIPRDARPVELPQIVMHASGAIEEFRQVRTPIPEWAASMALPGETAWDLVFLLAEFVENATRYSAYDVEVTCTRVTAGLMIEVEDHGLGMDEAAHARWAAALANPLPMLPEQWLDGRLGLLVAGRLARRHDLHTSLRPSVTGGTTARIVVPSNLLLTAPAAAQHAPQQTPAAVRAPVRKPAPSPALPPGTSPQAPAGGLTDGPPTRHPQPPAGEQKREPLPRRRRPQAAPAAHSGPPRPPAPADPVQVQQTAAAFISALPPPAEPSPAGPAPSDPQTPPPRRATS
jgi:anti-sigma regulatory factor (Ser/Thr protein kinase)